MFALDNDSPPSGFSMKSYALNHLSRPGLQEALHAIAARERGNTADFLAHLGEAEAVCLYKDAGCSSMFEYCVSELKLAESAAYRRIQVARACRKFPQLFHAIADGRLNLTTVLLLRPHFAKENVDELIRAATHKRKAQIERLIAERFGVELAPELVGRSTFKEIAPGIFEMRVVLRRETVDKIRHAQDLLSHSNPTRNMAVVMDRVLDLAIPQLEKQKFATTDRPRVARTTAPDSRHIPAALRRAVYQRDGGRCRFVSAKGHRCESRHQLEVDHIVPVAKGGKTELSNLRLFCRAHNQLAAIDAFGLAFMVSQIESARVERSTVVTPGGEVAVCSTRSGAS